MILYNIENILKQMCDGSPRNEYFYEKYVVLKNVLFEKFYEQIPSKYPGYTSHTYKHIKGVLLQIDRLCKERVDKNYPDDPNHINLYELYLLLMSVIFHDVAMVIEKRADHGDITKILELFDGIILSDDEREWIKVFVKCHQSSVKIEELIPMREKFINNWRVHPQFIAAMLRLADELDENKIRAYEVGLKLGTVDEEQVIYHEYAKHVDGIFPESRYEKIAIEISMQLTELFKKFKKGETDVLFINEIITRIDKTNVERKYCMGFTQYYLEYKNIELRLYLKDGDKPEKTISFAFDDRRGEADFWEANKSIIDRYHK